MGELGQDRDLARADEDEDDRLDRELTELLNELRVVMPGVQVLFGFLLTVPFQQRFADVTAFQRDVYLVTLLLSGAATAFLIAPTAYHRITFRTRQRPHLIRVGTIQALAGLVLLALAMMGAVLLVTDWLFGDLTVGLAVGFFAALYVWLWFAVPLLRRLSRRRAW